MRSIGLSIVSRSSFLMLIRLVILFMVSTSNLKWVTK
jgi:hypothetical protein